MTLEFHLVLEDGSVEDVPKDRRMKGRSPASLPSGRRLGKAEPEMSGEESQAGIGEIEE